MSNEPMPFKREDRYVVIKRSDLDKLSPLDRDIVQSNLEHISAILFGWNVPERERLVIESDWPEYAPAWAAIEARVTGQPAAQPQGEPVAFQWRCKTVNEGSQWRHWVNCTEEDYNKTIENPGPRARGIIREARKLYAEQPAPITVVLPARKPEPSCMTTVDDDREAAIWNACIVATARLNPGAKP